MGRHRLLASLLTILAVVSSIGGVRADELDRLRKSFDERIKPLLAKSCVECHDGESETSELDLSRFDSAEKALEALPVWDRIAQRVRDGEMPPEGSPELSDDERRRIVRWVERLPRPEDCEQLATDETQNFYSGYVMSRRLNRREYGNSIRDLFGVDLHADEFLPADGAGGEGFDTAGAALFTSAIHVEKYLAAADHFLRNVLPESADGLSPEVAAARDAILFVTPDEQTTPREAARRIVAHFARRAFRRPVEEAEVERLLTMFDRGSERGDSFVASLRLSLKAVLISPNFLFLIEPVPPEEGVYRLGQYQIAQRLSFFLWSSLPDEGLLQLAADGRLDDPDVLRSQARRMLRDPRSRGLAESFAVQWLGIGALGTTTRPDSGRFPEFDAELAEAMRAESMLFFDAIFREDRSLVELLDADFTFVNERLAAHYGLPGVTGSELRRVELTDRRRGGVVTQASVLTTTSYPLRTSPVLRGKWLLEEILGDRVPPPPPDAGVLPADDRQPDGLTLRERLEQHRANPECAACHQRMDPLGFGLENFDAIGRWRDEEGGQAVDASAKLPSGQEFRGPAELKSILVAKKPQFLRNLTRKMLGYALGRELNKFDQCVVDETLKALEAGGDRPSVLVESIVLSYPFLHRYAKK